MRNRKLVASAAMAAALAGGTVIGVTLGNPLASGASSGSTATTTTQPTGSKNGMPGNGMPGGGMPGNGMPGGGMHLGGRGGFNLEVAAKTLKLSTDELKKQLQAGKSLADIAKAQGVSKQTLIDALVKAGEAKLDEAKKGLPDAISKLVDAKPPTGAPTDRKGRPGMPGRGAGLEPVAKVLGMSVDDLRAALKDGKTLAQIAKDKGVDKQKVIDALAAEAKTHLDEAVKAKRLTQAEADEKLAEITKGITSWVNDGKPAGGGPGPMGGPGKGPMGGGDGGPWGH